MTDQPAKPTPAPRLGPFARRPRTTDALLGVVVIVSTLAAAASPEGETFDIDRAAGLPVVAYLLLAVAAASLLWRRTHPVAVAALSAVVTTVWWMAGYEGDISLALIVGLYSVGRYVADTRISFGVAGAAVLYGVMGAAAEARQLWEGVLVVVGGWIPWYVGHRIRARHTYLAMLEERAVHLERERVAVAAKAAAEERAEIARELHDVVAHRVSMMTVQAGAAKTIASADPEAALGAVEAIEQEGRRALAELRHLLGVLRPENESASGRRPQGAMADIPDLVDRMHEAGYKTDLRMAVTDLDEVPSRVGLSVYRVVQEALTNVVKHTGPDTHVSIDISVDGGRVNVQVSDNGTALSTMPAGGFGLGGMRERMALLGGGLEAGPRAGGGWRVRAWIPMAVETQ